MISVLRVSVRFSQQPDVTVRNNYDILYSRSVRHNVVAKVTSLEHVKSMLGK